MNTLTEKQQQKIDEIMDNFDFGKVAKVMEFLEWKWWNRTSEGGFIPESYELRAKAREELKKICLRPTPETNQWSLDAGSGGLYITRYGGIDSKGAWENLDLKFAIENWFTEEE